jgi:hypothetical protein
MTLLTDVSHLEMQRLIPLVESPHDLAEDDAEGVGRRFVVLGEPSSAGSGIGPGEFGKEKLRFVGPCKPREIAELDPRSADLNDLADTSVRVCRNGSADYCGRISGFPRYKTHDTLQQNATLTIQKEMFPVTLNHHSRQPAPNRAGGRDGEDHPVSEASCAGPLLGCNGIILKIVSGDDAGGQLLEFSDRGPIGPDNPAPDSAHCDARATDRVGHRFIGKTLVNHKFCEMCHA